MEMSLYVRSLLGGETEHKTVEGQLETAKKYNSKYIDLSEMGLLGLDMSLIPDTCEVLCLQGNRLRAVPTPLPPRLRQLFIENNQLTSIPEGVLPPTLEYLCAPWNQIAEVPATWPPALTALYLGANQIRTLPPLSKGVQLMNVEGNPLLVPQKDEERAGPALHLFVERLRAEQDRVEEEASRRRCEERVRQYTDELLAIALHPDRVDEWARQGFRNVFPDSY
jgi:hypothetical protein